MMNINLLGKKPVNLTRQKCLDLSKFIAICGMVFVHVIISGRDDIGLWDQIPDFDSYLLIGSNYIFGTLFAAPVFMFCMGICICYTKKKEPIELFKRGVQLFIWGYILNFFRYVVPYAIFQADGYTTYGITGGIGLLLMNDIFQFAGLSFIVFAILKKLKFKIQHILILAFLLSVSSYFYGEFNTNNDLVDALLGLIITTRFSYFSLFSWFIIFAAGIFYGILLIRLKNQDRFMLLGLILSFICLVLSVFWMWTIGAFNNLDNLKVFFVNDMCFWAPQFHVSLIFISSAVFCVSISYYIAKILPEKINNFLRETSNNLTSIYVLQWIIIGWTSIFAYSFVINSETEIIPPDIKCLFLVALIVLIAVILLAKLYKHVKKIVIKSWTENII